MSTRTYNILDSIVFRKTKEEFGGLSNMAPGFSLNVHNTIIPTSEHLYQACRFPNYPEIQWDIIKEKSPMRAKWIGRANIKKSRQDWELIQFQVMQWVLEIKLSQNWHTFSELLRSTRGKHIVELTNTPKVWGAVRTDNQLRGVNALGRLLMALREKYAIPNIKKNCVQPLNISEFKFLGYEIELICDEFDDSSSPSIFEGEEMEIA